MYAVIFTAELNALDGEYHAVASRMRALAVGKYGCTGFSSCSEGGREIAVSYWPSETHIRAWKNDPEHRAAQAAGRARWYRNYRVEIVRIEREYGEFAGDPQES